MTPTVVTKRRRSRGWTADELSTLTHMVRSANPSGAVSGARWAEIAAHLNRPLGSCQTKWYEMKNRQQQLQVVRKRPAKEALPPASGSIVDRARDILRADGFSRKQIEFMHTDQVMREANRRLKAADMPQLGRKPEWLV